MNTRLIIGDDSVYEIDEECMKKKDEDKDKHRTSESEGLTDNRRRERRRLNASR